MDNNLGEIICEAVDTIVSKRLEDLKYDITKTCTIIDNAQKRLGKYSVQEEILIYDAYTSNTELNIGDSVIVLIPNGDYNEQKLILNKIVNDNDFTSAATYISPLKSMIDFTNNIIEKDLIQPDSNSGVKNEKYFSLLANENNNIGYLNPEVPTYKLLYSIPWAKYNNFDRIGISADFQTWLADLDVVSGDYGLEFLFFDKNTSIADQENRDATYRFTFSINDILGDPYNFPIYFTQEKVIDISQLLNIDSLHIYLYQRGNFKSGDGEYIIAKDDNGYNLIDNIFVGNIKIIAGYDISEYTKDTVTLTTDDYMSYSKQRGNNNKVLTLHWVHKIDANNYEIIDNVDESENEIEVYWVRYGLNVEADISNMDIVGANWVYQDTELQIDKTNPFNCILIIDTNNRLAYDETVKIKAVCRIKQNNNWHQYESNILTFATEDITFDAKTYEAVMGLSINCDDGYRGNYFIYGADNQIIDESQGTGYIRNFRLQYNGLNIDTDENTGIDANDIKNITWTLPTNAVDGTPLTMLNFPYKSISNTGTNITYSTGLTPSLKYTISDTWYPSIANNTITCKLQMNSGEEYKASKSLLFGKANSQGSNYNLVIEYKDPNKNAIEVLMSSGNNPMHDQPLTTFVGRLYDMQGPVRDIENEGTWKWELLNGENFQQPNQVNSQEISLQLNSDIENLTTNYAILKLTYSISSGQDITAYKPIAIKCCNSDGTARCDIMSGASMITYNISGKPTYYTGPYSLSKLNNMNLIEEINVSKLDWELHSPNNAHVTESGTPAAGYPFLKKTKDNKVALSASNIYLKNINNYKICVVAKAKTSDETNGNIYWIQPIHITQSLYDLAIVNDWDGETVVSDDTTIKAPAIATGTKNADGTFSGITLGKVLEGGTEEVTGLYGIYNGDITFQLTDKGQATFMSKDGIQDNITVLFGSSNLIYNNDYETSGKGLFLFNFDDKYIHFSKIGIENTGLFLSRGMESNSYLRMGTETGQELLNFSPDSLIIQSPGYEVEKGLQFNVSSGIINLPGTDNYISGLVANSGKVNNIMKIGDFKIDKDGKIFIGDKTLEAYIREVMAKE